MRMILLAIAFALASTATVVHAAPRNQCAAQARLIKVAVQAKQKGVGKEQIEALANQVEPAAKPAVIAAINRVYSSKEFDAVPPQVAAGILSAACGLAQ